MRILDDEKDVELCLSKFEKLIDKEMGINGWFALLDNVMFEYSQLLMENGQSRGVCEIESTKLYYLKNLRDLFIADE